jgi:hypothetical protein
VRGGAHHAGGRQVRQSKPHQGDLACLWPVMNAQVSVMGRVSGPHKIKILRRHATLQRRSRWVHTRTLGSVAFYTYLRSPDVLGLLRRRPGSARTLPATSMIKSSGHCVVVATLKGDF